MFDPPGKTPCGLSHDPFKTGTIPRPIRWTFMVDGAGWEERPRQRVQPVRVKSPPIRFECENLNTLRIPSKTPMGMVAMVFDRAIAIHTVDAMMTPKSRLGRLKMQPLARMRCCGSTDRDHPRQMTILGNPKPLLTGHERAPEKIAHTMPSC